MLVLPSALELESLSDHELMERITIATTAIKAAQTPYGDDSDEQQLYRALITDHNRREAVAATSSHNSS
ncbi:MAG: hypothetical protein ABI970_25705 [Chloroflexota bacterium]